MMVMEMTSVPEQGFKHSGHFTSYGPKVQSHLVPRLSPRQDEHSISNSVMNIHLVELRVDTWSSPPGTEMVLRIYPGTRRMDVELSTLDMGLYKISWDFTEITALNLIEAEVLGKVEMILASDPQKYRGTMVSYPHREILWALDHDVSPAPYGGLGIVLIGRKEPLLDSYRYLIGHDLGLKNAFQHPHSPRSPPQNLNNHSSHSNHSNHNNHSHPPHLNTSHHNPPPMHSPHAYPPPSPGGSLMYQPYPLQPVPSEELNAARFKPAEFNAKRLRIGSWEKKSYFAGDLKVKFLYVKKRMVWEILDVFGLTKIEILFKDITSLAVQQTPNEVCMVVDVAKLPFFYTGYPQKMKNTRWEHTSDMTGGQASVCRTHVLYLPKNCLQTHMDKLVQSDSHMRTVTSYSTSHSSPSSPQQSSSSPFPAISATQFAQTFTPANMTAHLKSAAHQPHGSTSSLLTDIAPARTTCKCTNGCGKHCACTKDMLWCDANCSCRGGAGRWSSACGNPSNLKLSSCARHALLDTASSAPGSPSAHKKPATHANAQCADPNKLLKLPCKCSSATLSDLVAEHECAECGAQFFYSFCFQCVVPVGAIWHCDTCGTCRDSREFHCDACGKCSYASPSNACRNCASARDTAPARPAWDRGDCVIM